LSDPNANPGAEAYVRRMDGYFVCDELAVLIHRLRELISDSQTHNRMVFLTCADDIFSDLLETVDRGWTTIEEIAGGLDR
jgi:hypothetical protein